MSTIKKAIIFSMTIVAAGAIFVALPANASTCGGTLSAGSGSNYPAINNNQNYQQPFPMMQQMPPTRPTRMNRQNQMPFWSRYFQMNQPQFNSPMQYQPQIMQPQMMQYQPQIPQPQFQQFQPQQGSSCQARGNGFNGNI